ncbi:hypothetical protein OROGR_009855 [Orobanche gracilis]
MAMTKMCNAAMRRIASAAEQRIAFSSISPSMATEAPILCGRGDKKTKRGKRYKGSYGNCRPKKEQKVERIKDKIEVPRDTFYEGLF